MPARRNRRAPHPPRRVCARALAAASLAWGTHAHGEAPKDMHVAKIYGNVNRYAYYFADLQVGSESQTMSVILDTGNHLTGFPCGGCTQCAGHFDKPYEFSSSSTAKWVPCGEECGHDSCLYGRCAYVKNYTEGSIVRGNYFEDTAAVGDGPGDGPGPRGTARMGCHWMETKFFRKQLANGILGLAPPHDGSLPEVLAATLGGSVGPGQAIFSMCLSTWGGRMTIGGYDNSTHHLPVRYAGLQEPAAEEGLEALREQAADAGPEEAAAGSVAGRISWLHMRASHKYRVFPEAMSLAGFQFVSDPGEIGDTIVDSGRTYSSFPATLYNTLESNLKEHCISTASGLMHQGKEKGGCKAQHIPPSCWRLTSPHIEERKRPTGFPAIRMTFKGVEAAEGATTVDWPAEAYLHRTADPEVWCYSFVSGGEEAHGEKRTVLGISWMLHKDVIFDLGRSRLGIAMADCPESHRLGLPEETSEAAAEQNAKKETKEVLFSVGVAAGFVLVGAGVVCWASHIRMMPSSRRGVRTGSRRRQGSSLSFDGELARTHRSNTMESVDSNLSAVLEEHSCLNLTPRGGC